MTTPQDANMNAVVQDIALRCPVCAGRWFYRPNRYTTNGLVVEERHQVLACTRCGAVVRLQPASVVVEQDIPGSWKGGL